MGAPPPGTQQDPKAANMQLMGFMVIMVVLFVVVGILPQRKRQKEHEKMLDSVGLAGPKNQPLPTG